MESTVYYQFKQWFECKEGKVLGNPFLLPQGSNLFTTEIEAINYLQTQIVNSIIHKNDVHDWELVKITQEVIPNSFLSNKSAYVAVSGNDEFAVREFGTNEIIEGGFTLSIDAEVWIVEHGYVLID